MKYDYSQAQLLMNVIHAAVGIPQAAKIAKAAQEDLAAMEEWKLEEEPISPEEEADVDEAVEEATSERRRV